MLKNSENNLYTKVFKRATLNWLYLLNNGESKHGTFFLKRVMIEAYELLLNLTTSVEPILIVELECRQISAPHRSHLG